MNKKKIKSMLIMMGTVLSLNMGSQLDVKASEVDKEKPSLQQGKEVSKNTETVNESKESKDTNDNKKVERIVIVRDEYTAPKYNASTQSPTEAVAKINAGKGEYEDYRVLKINNVKRAMITSLNQAMKLERKDKGSDLTQREVTEAANKAVEAYTLMSMINQEYACMYDYEDAGIEGVTKDNCKDINALLINQPLYRTKEIQAKVNAILQAQNNISEGCASAADYKEFGIENVKSSLVNPINKIVKTKSVELGRVLKSQEVKNVVNAEIKKLEAIDAINNGEAYLEDFTVLNIKNVNEDNLEFIVNALNGGNFETAEQIQKAVDERIEVLQTIKVVCSGQGAAKDFKKVGIESVTDENVSAINAKIIGKNYTEVSQIKAVVEMTLKELLKDKIVKIEQGTASVNDIAVVGIKGVTEENISFVLERVKGRSYDSIEELQEEVDSACDLFDTLKRINNGQALVDDYRTIGADFVTRESVDFINIEMKRSFDYTINGLKVKAEAAKELYDAYVRINNGEAEISDYSLIGATDVNSSNLADVNLAVKNQLKDAKAYVKFNVQEIIKVVVARNTAIENINAGRAKAVDYKTLGVSGVTDENLEIINEGIKGTDPKNDYEVQNSVTALVKVYGALSRAKAGNASVQDYTLIDRNTTVNNENYEFVNYYLKGSKSLTIKGISDKMAYAVNVYGALTRANNGNASAEDFILLTIDNVPSKIIDFVNGKLAGSKYTTIEGIKSKVNEIINLVVSLERINGGNGSLEDYERYGIKNVEEKNKNFINSQVKDSGLKTAEEIQTAVDRANYLYDITVRINEGNGSLKDYEEIGANGLTEKNLKYVNSYVKDNGSINLITLRNTIIKAANEYSLIEKINSAASEVTDYRTLDLVDVTYTNIGYINEKIFEKQIIFNIDGTINETVDYKKIKDEIQAFIYTCTDVYVNINKINSGVAKLSDYETLKIKNVTEENYIFVNSHLSGNDSTDLEVIQAKVNEAVSEFGAIKRINEGSASIDDYKNIIGTDFTVDKETGERVEVPYVNSENINYINPLIKDKDYTTPSAIKSFVLNAIKEFKGLEKMTKGQAELSDFTSLEIKDVNSKNLKYINESLKGIYFRSVGDAQKAINIAINHYNALQRVITGEAIEGDYKLLGVEGVTKLNIAFVNYHLKDRVFETDAEVQREGEKAFKLFDAVQRINAGEGFLTDYVLVENRVSEDSQSEVIDYVDNVNITYVNKCLMGKDLDKADIIVENIKKTVADYNALVKMDKGKASLEDYKTIGAGGVTEENLSFVNENMAGKGYYKENAEAVHNAVEAVISNVNTYNIISKVNAGAAKLGEYEELGISNKVTIDNVLFIDANIKNRNLKTVDEVKSQVSFWVSQYTSFAKINSGEARINDYTNLGLSGVDSSIRIYVNADLKEKNRLTADELQEIINSHKDIYESLKNINLGTATAEDFKKIGRNTELTKDELQYLNVKLKGANQLTKFDAVNKVEHLLAQSGAYGKINSGNGTLEDYTTVGALRVTAYNIDYINNEIKDKVDAYGTNIQAQINSILELYNAVKVINDGGESSELSGDVKIVKDYRILNNTKIEYDQKAGTKFNSIREAISLYRKILNGRNLYKSEIINIIDQVNSSPEDAKVVLQRIIKQSQESIKDQGRELESFEQERIAKNVMESMQQVVRNIFTGQASVEDFYSIGEMRVNSENIKVINKDIKDHDTVIMLSKYRLKDVEKAVSIGKAILTINNGNESSKVDEYALIDRKVDYSNDTSSKLGLIRSQVKLDRDLKNKEYLNRDEILNIVDEIEKSEEDKRVIMPEILRAVEKAKADNNGILSPQDEKKVIDDVYENRKNIISKIVKGEGYVEDFRALGEIKVNNENIQVINTDIKENRTIEKLSELRIDGLADAVKKGIAVFDINNYNYGNKASNYTTLDQEVSVSNKPNSAYTLIGDAITIKRAIKNNEYLTRNEIINIITEINGSLEDQAVIIPKIIEEMNRRINKGDKLTSEDVVKIENDVKEQIKSVCTRIRGAEGSLADFKYLGMTNVNENNIASINEDIKQSHTVTADGIYRLQGLEDAILDGIAIQYINNANANDRSVADQFGRLNLPSSVSYLEDETSKFKLIIAQIKLKKVLEGGRSLVRQEIIDIVKDMDDKENFKDMQKIIPKVNSEKTIRERNLGKDLTADETKALIEEVKANLKDVCGRISTGNGTLKDFSYLGESKVNEDNITIINNDIKETGKVSLASSYRVSGLEDAVKAGAAIYYINSNNTDKSVEDKFATLGFKDIEYSTDETSKFKLILSKVKIEKAMKELPYLNRSEISKMIEEVNNNYKDNAVIIPRVNALLGNTLTAEETKKVVDEVKDNINKICQRVLNGEASVEDFNYLGQTDVNENNLKVINEDILATKRVSLISAYRVNGIEDAVKQGLAIYNINNNNDKTVEDSYSKLELTIPYSTKDEDMFNLVHFKVEMDKYIKGKENLNRKDIQSIVTAITNNREDLAKLIPLEIKEVHKALTEGNKKVLTADEVNAIIKNVEDNLKNVCDRICSGNGSIEDFALLSETRVNKDNIEVINNDIKKNNSTLSRLSKYRVDKLDKAVGLGLAVYNINNNNEDEAALADFTELGINIDTASDSGKTLKLIETQVKINRMLQDDKPLSREEIKALVKDIYANLEDYKVIIPKVNKAIIELKDEKTTSKDIEKLINDVKENIKKVCQRVSIGSGSVKDFEYLGETRVNDSNIEVINTDIKYNNISSDSAYRLKNLQDAVTAGAAIYGINNGDKNSAVKNFDLIGIKLEYSDDDVSLFKLMQSAVAIDRRTKDNRYITRTEIKDIENKLKDNLEDYKILIPSINLALNAAEKSADKPLDSAEVTDLINNIKSQRKLIITNICSGEASVDDYKAAGIDEISVKNIDIINAEVKKYRNLKRASDYRLASADEVLKKTNAIYLINIGKLNERCDIREIHNFKGDVIRTMKSNSRVGELEDLGLNLAWNNEDNSEMGLLKQSVEIMRKLVGGRYLTRSEILQDIYKNIKDNFEDAKLMIPRISHALIDEETDRSEDVKSKTVSEVIEEQEKIVKDAVSRIFVGEGTVADYQLFKETTVTESNVDLVNNVIKEHRTVSRISPYRLEGLSYSVKLGFALTNINSGNVSSSCDEYALLGEKVDYSEEETSLFMLIKDSLEIERDLKDGKNLNKNEILSIIKNVRENEADMKVYMPRVKAAIKTAKLTETLSVDEEKALIESVKNSIKTSINKIVNGLGEVSDFVSLGESKVNEDNIKFINADINEDKEKSNVSSKEREFEIIKKISDYRVSGLSEVTARGIAVYTLNIDKPTEDEDGLTKEFKAIHREVPYDNENGSALKVIQGYIMLEKRINDNKAFGRQELMDYFDEVMNNFDRYKVIVPKIDNEIFAKELGQETLLTAKEVLQVKTDKEKELQLSIKRIVSGMGTLSDYSKFGERRVTGQNRSVINADIRKNGNVSAVKNYSVSGLTEAVDAGIAVFNLNKGNETVNKDGTVNELLLLGYDVQYSKDDLSQYQLIKKGISIQRRLENNDYIDRDSIYDVVNFVMDNEKKAANKYPLILTAIEKKDLQKDYEITRADVKFIYDQIMNDTGDTVDIDAIIRS